MRKFFKRHIGQILLDAGFFPRQTLNSALQEQKQTKELLGQILVRMGVIKTADFKISLLVQEYLSNIDDAVKTAAGERQLLGELLVQSGQITNEQLNGAIAEQTKSGEKLGEVFVRLGFLSDQQLNALLSLQQNQGRKSSNPLRLGELLVTTGHISRKHLKDALLKQSLSQKKLGEVLVQEGYARQSQIEYGMGLQKMLMHSVLAVIFSVGVNSTSMASDVQLEWDPSPDASVAGYRVYYQADSPAQPFQGTGSAEGAAPVDVQNQATATITGLDPTHTYYFAVTAYDSAGLESVYSNVLTIEPAPVSPSPPVPPPPDLTPPSLSLTSPVNSAVVSGTAVVSATASDDIGVSRVEFYDDGALLFAGNAAPFNLNWDTQLVANGSHTLLARVYDFAGNLAESTISVTVNNVVPDTVAPAVSSFSMPSSATSLTVAISSFAASDNVDVTGYLITESASAPLIKSSGWSSAPPSSFTFSAEGFRTAYAWTRDAAGNVSAGSSRNVTITLPDTAAPSITSFLMPASSNSLTVAISSFAATDNVGVTGYLITESASAPSINASGWSAAPPSSFTFSGEGVRTAYAWTKDAAGNVSAGLSRSVTITLPDIAAPVVTSFTLPESASSLTVAISSFTASDKFGVVGYLVTESASAPSANAIGWSASVPSSFSFSGEGVRTAYAWTRDAAGNVSAGLSRSVSITLPDITAPVVSSFSIPATSNSLTVAISSFAASDKIGVTGYLVTESASAPAANASGWSAAPPSSFTFSGEGVRTAYAWTKDAAGNLSAGLSRSVTITLPDITAPVVSSFSIPATANSLTVAISSFAASDKIGVTGYLVTESASAPSANSSGWTSAPPSSFTFSAEGVRTAYAWTKDAAGNVSAGFSRSVTITLPDIAAPVVTSFTLPESASSLTVAISSFTASDKVGVAGYLVTESASAPSANATNWSASVPSSFTFSGEGVRTAYAWTKDAAGNLSAGLSRSVTITLPDITAPVVSSFSIPATANSLTVAISSFAASDKIGVTGYFVTESASAPSANSSGWSSAPPSSFTFSAEGVRTAYAWTKDAAGNVSAGFSRSVAITLPDIAAPVVTSFTLPESASSLTVAISSFTASDKVGVAGYLVTESASAPSANATNWSASVPSSFTFSGEGVRTAYAWTKDAAGNVSAGLSRSVIITLPDITAPVLSSFTMPASASSLTVAISSFSAIDEVGVTGYLVTESASAPSASASGWSASPPSSFTFSGEGSRIAYAWTKDAAGNVSVGRSCSVTITLPDTAAPIVTSFTLPESASSLTVAISSFTASDNVGVVGYLVTESASAPAANASGWSATPPSSFTFSAEGGRTAYAWNKDAAGNVSAGLSRSVSITLPDTTAPTVSLDWVDNGRSVTVAVNASDNFAVSKVEFYVNGALQGSSTSASYSFNWNTAAVANGAYTLSAKAYDAAGNMGQSASAIVSVFNDSTAPSVALATPLPNSTVRGVVSVTVNASDNVGVSRIEHYLNGVLLAVSTSAPYAYNWNTQQVKNGSYTLTAMAYDAAGNVSNSAGVSVTVSNTVKGSRKNNW